MTFTCVLLDEYGSIFRNERTTITTPSIHSMLSMCLIHMVFHMPDSDCIVCLIQCLTRHNIQGAVITRSNMTWYYIHHYSYPGRIYISVNHKRHLIPHPNGRVMGCLCEDVQENWYHYNGTALYLVKHIYAFAVLCNVWLHKPFSVGLCKTFTHLPQGCLIGSGCMMTSSNENIFRITGPLCGEFAGHQ